MQPVLNSNKHISVYMYLTCLQMTEAYDIFIPVIPDAFPLYWFSQIIIPQVYVWFTIMLQNNMIWSLLKPVNDKPLNT